MLYNYHTHTFRCGHASGEDREYVENAIKNGLKVLGFSDHAPYVFPKSFFSAHRMQLEDLDGYVESVRKLQKEYAKDIRILLGFELEYYPKFHQEEMEFLKTVQPDYLLLGQHFCGNEINELYAPFMTTDQQFTTYISQVIEGLKTGDFAYLAHPDLGDYHYSKEVVEREYRRLCEAAKGLNVPLEINLLGMRTHRHYPDKRFFKIAAEVGNTVVIGADAHIPQDVIDPTSETIAKQWISELGLQFIENPFM